MMKLFFDQVRVIICAGVGGPRRVLESHSVAGRCPVVNVLMGAQDAVFTRNVSELALVFLAQRVVPLQQRKATPMDVRLVRVAIRVLGLGEQGADRSRQEDGGSPRFLAVYGFTQSLCAFLADRPNAGKIEGSS